jgi:hypothetical protein
MARRGDGRWLRLGCGSCRDLPRFARHDPQIAETSTGHNTRSKFNTALDIEAQGFCIIRQ